MARLRLSAFDVDWPERPPDAAVRQANLRRVGRLFRPHRRQLALLFGLIAVSSALGVVPAFLLKRVLEAILNHDNRQLSWSVAGIILIAVVVGILGIAQTLLSNQVGQRVMHELRESVFRHLQRMSLAFFTHTRGGEVQSRIANDIGGVQNVVTNAAMLVAAQVTTVVATAVAMIALDWRLAAFALGLVPLFALLTRRVGVERRRIAKTTQETLADISALVQESLSVSGILLGKTMGRSAELADRFAADSRRLADLEVRQRMAGRWVMASIQTSFAFMPAAVYWFGGVVLGGSSVSVPTLVAFTMLQTRLFSPFSALLSVGLDVQVSLALFDRIFEYRDIAVDITERDDPLERVDDASVAFDNVWFRYPGSDWGLEEVSFEVPAGSKTAIVGETGSGKTTLAYLIARLYDVERGTVKIGGIDVRDLSFRALADCVGVVSQDTYLFHASVRENLLFAKPDASDSEIRAAAAAARIDDVIDALPQGYDTLVGERGHRFSGGEKQRIAIARTLLRDPPVLVLDEATSSLDTRTERLVREALHVLSEGRTTIAIAHRLLSVRDADQVVVLHRGRVVEVGTHAELVSRQGHYAGLAQGIDLLANEPLGRE